jgi:hypothetical protein
MVFWALRRQDCGPKLGSGYYFFGQRSDVELIFLLLRCFLWLVSELGHGWDSQVELAGSVVGGGSEVDEIFKSPSHSLC